MPCETLPLVADPAAMEASTSISHQKCRDSGPSSQFWIPGAWHIQGHAKMKLKLFPSEACCSLNEDTVDFFLLAMSLEC
jgi:hypothetical protein